MENPPVAVPLFPRAIVARCLPFLIYMAFIAIAELLGWLGVSQADQRWLYAVKVGAVAVALAYFWRDYDELHRWHLTVASTAVAIVAGLIVLILWLSLGADWMTIGSAAGFDPTTDGDIDWALVAVRIAGAALVVPVMEELFWRSFLLRWLDNKRFAALAPGAISIKAIAISSVLFGVEHNLWLAGLVAGLVYACLYRWHRSLWSPVLAHAVTNGALGAWVIVTGSWHYW
ncbi:CAAX prenyl protease-related protein [Massilia sp. DWR3-1-1]|uniref:CAAX prenyl protease-related protein n=1 Tax=Massilia sp. DWR3-1-1 TaxID=2804559 RepID=UPI003CEC5F0D